MPKKTSVKKPYKKVDYRADEGIAKPPYYCWHLTRPHPAKMNPNSKQSFEVFRYHFGVVVEAVFLYVS